MPCAKTKTIIGLALDGLEIEFNAERVKYAVKGRWHHCSLDQFIRLLARSFKPPKQVKESG